MDAVERWAAPPAVTAVVDAVLGTPYPAAVPTEAAQRFNALADGTPLYYVAELEGGEVRPDDMAFRFAFSDREHLQWVYLQSPTAQGVWVAWLAFFLDNPQRERLRRCQSCRRWFVDETRNKSARRCSRACTIAWSNRQRGQRKKRGGRR